MTRTLRIWAAGILVLFGLVGLLPATANAAKHAKTPTPASSESTSSSATLAARLGGSKTSFEKKYGTPVKGKSKTDISVFNVQGYGLVAVAFTNSHATEITIAADRLNHKPLTEADKADWSIATASTNAEQFLPADSRFGKPVKSKEQITITGSSKELAPAISAKTMSTLNAGGAPGDMIVDYSLDTAGNVYSVDINIGNGGSATASSQTTSSSSSASGKSSSSSSNQTANGPVKHCRDFKTQAEAQAYFDAHGGDSNPAVAGMDGDKDGKPCETLP